MQRDMNHLNDVVGGIPHSYEHHRHSFVYKQHIGFIMIMNDGQTRHRE